MSKFSKEMLLASVQQSNLTLSDGKKIRVRAFLMREFKILMLASESESNMEDSIIQVLKGCVMTPGIDLEKLPIFDVETIYVAVWKLSKGTSIIPVKFTCTNTVMKMGEDEVEREVQCNGEIKVNANLNKAKLSKVPDSNVVISDNLRVEMRYPTVYETEFFDVKKESDLFDLVLRCVRSVTMNEETMVVGTDVSYEELVEIMDYIDDTGFAKMASFVNQLPQLSLTLAVKCPDCGHCEPVELVGLADFFG